MQTDRTEPDSEANGVAIQPDGKIIVVGDGSDGSDGYVDVMRFNTNGTLDTSFSGDGKITDTCKQPSCYFTSVLVRPDGSILVGGSIEDRAVVMALNSDGTTDTAFNANSGDAGYATYELGGYTPIYTMAQQPNGKIVLGGRYALNASHSLSHSYLARLNADGTFDAGFGVAGVKQIPIAANDGIFGVALDSSGRIAVAGYGDAVGSDNSGSLVARFRGNEPFPDPLPITIPLSSKFSSSLKSRIKASKFKSISGTATGTGLRKVEIAIQKVDSKLLKKSKRCEFVKSPKGSLTKTKATKGKCSKPKWLTAKGTTSWSYKLTKSLKKGKYVISVRSDGAGAAVSKTLTKKITLY